MGSASALTRRRQPEEISKMRKWIIGAALVVLIAGCSSTPEKTETPVDESPATPAATTSGATTSGATTSGVTGTALPTLHKDPNNILAKQRSIYFDYDQFVVKDQYRPMVEAHAKYLQSNRGLKITIQGNTDERGTREYNIALAQKRADAVKKTLLLLGVQEVQIETVSFGKEKPRREGHDETSWAENRRADIVYIGE
jgi:peptidoglycan-associated lipoprotein